MTEENGVVDNKEKSKLISVIVPCYNVENYIDRCMESLVKQTIGIEKLELIFIDDASTDTTLEKLYKWEEKYPESIMIICCEENHKQGAARNTGLQYASADYVGFVDSDDYIEVDMFYKLYQKAADYNCDMVCGLFVREEQSGKVAMKMETCDNAGRLIRIDNVEDRKVLMRGSLPGGVWGKIYRKKMILDNEIYFPEDILYEDNYWSAFLKQAVSSYYILDELCYHYMVNEQSTIMQEDALHHLDRLVIELMKVEEYKRRGLFETYHDEIEISFIKMYFINTIRILFVRFRDIPYDIIYTMQENVKILFPEYNRNPYLVELPPLQREILKMVEVPLTREKIDILANAYRQVLRKEE